METNIFDKLGVYLDEIEPMYVKLGEIVYTTRPEKYNLLGIGTCISIFLYDINKKRYGMSHCLLPLSKEDRLRAKSTTKRAMPGKYTDATITAMVLKFKQGGTSPQNLKAKIVGGGQIYNDALKIGLRNIEAARRVLLEEGVEIEAEDVGGKSGRSILQYNQDGTILIRKDGVKYNI